MKTWAFSVVVAKQSIERNVVNFNHQHTCAMLEAANADEAKGKALRIAQKLFPPADGWTNHHVAISSAENVITPEGAFLNM